LSQSKREKEKKKNYVGSETTPYINQEKGGPKSRKSPQPGKEKGSEDLEGDKPPPAPYQDLESNWIFQERVNLCAQSTL